jgi:hypothetical protein
LACSQGKFAKIEPIDFRKMFHVGDQMQEDEMGTTCSTHLGEDERHEERDPLGRLRHRWKRLVI